MEDNKGGPLVDSPQDEALAQAIAAKQPATTAPEAGIEAAAAQPAAQQQYFEPAPSDAEDDGVADPNEEDEEGQKRNPAAQEVAEDEFTAYTPKTKNRKAKRKDKGGIRSPPPPASASAPVAAKSGGDESKDAELPAKPAAAKEEEDEGPISDKKGGKGGKNAKKNAKKKQKGKAGKPKDMTATEEAPAAPADAAPEAPEAEAKEEAASPAAPEASAEADKEATPAEPEPSPSLNGEAKVEEGAPDPAEPAQEPAAPSEESAGDAGAPEATKSEEPAPAADPSPEPIDEVKDEPPAEPPAESEAAPTEDAKAESQPTEEEAKADGEDAPAEPAALAENASPEAEPPKGGIEEAPPAEPEAPDNVAPPAEGAAKEDTSAAEVEASEKEEVSEPPADEAPAPNAEAGAEPAAPENQEVEGPAEVERADEPQDSATAEGGPAEDAPAEEAKEEGPAAGEPAAVTEAEADPKEEPAPAAEAEAVEGGAKEKPEPGSPSTKQVRFADEPEVIKAPLARNGRGKPAKEEAKTEDAAADAAADEVAAPSEEPAVAEAPAQDEVSTEDGDAQVAEGDTPAPADEPATAAGGATEELPPAPEKEEEPKAAEEAPASDKDGASPDGEATAPCETPAEAEPAEAAADPAPEDAKDDEKPTEEEEAAPPQTTEAEPEVAAAVDEADAPAAAADGEPVQPEGNADAADKIENAAEAEASEAHDQPAEEVEGEKPEVSGEDVSKDEPEVEAAEAAEEAAAETAPAAEDAPADVADEPATDDAGANVEDAQPAKDEASEPEAAAAADVPPSEDKDEAPAVPDADKEAEAPADGLLPEPKPPQDEATPAEPEVPAMTEPEAPPPAEHEEPAESEAANEDGDKETSAAEQEPTPGDTEAHAPEALAVDTEANQATVEDADAEEEAEPQAGVEAAEAPADAVAEAEDAKPVEPEAAAVAAVEAPEEKEEPPAEEAKGESPAEPEPSAEEAAPHAEKPAEEVTGDAGPAEAAAPEDNADVKHAEGAELEEASKPQEVEEVPPAVDAPEAIKDAEEARPAADLEKAQEPEAKDAPEPEAEGAPAAEVGVDEPAAADVQGAPAAVPAHDKPETETAGRDLEPAEDDAPGENQAAGDRAKSPTLDPIDEEGSPRPEEPEAGVQEVHGQEEEGMNLHRAIDDSTSDAKAGEDEEDEAVSGEAGGAALAATAERVEEPATEAAQEESAPDVGLENAVDDSSEGAAPALDEAKASAAESEPRVQAEQENIAGEATPADAEPTQGTKHDGDESDSEAASGAELTEDVPLGISDENAAAETLAVDEHDDAATSDGIETPADDAGGTSLSISPPEPNPSQDGLDTASQLDDTQLDDGVQLASGTQTPIQAEPDTGASIDASSDAAHPEAESETPAEPTSTVEETVPEQGGEEQTSPVPEDSEGDSDGFVLVEKDEAADELLTSPMEPAGNSMENLEDEGGALAEPEDSFEEREGSPDRGDFPPEVSEKTATAQVEPAEEQPPPPNSNEPEAVPSNIDHDDESSPTQPEAEKEALAATGIDVVEKDEPDLEVVEGLSEAAQAEEAEVKQLEAPTETREAEELQPDEADQHDPNEPANKPSDTPEAESPLADSNHDLHQSPPVEEALEENFAQDSVSPEETEAPQTFEQEVIDASLPVSDSSVEPEPPSAEEETADSAALESGALTGVCQLTATEAGIQSEEADTSLQPQLVEISDPAENDADDLGPEPSSHGEPSTEALPEPTLDSADLSREAEQMAEPDFEPAVLQSLDEAFNQAPQVPAEGQPQQAGAAESEEEDTRDHEPQLLRPPGLDTTEASAEARESSPLETDETDNAQPNLPVSDEPVAAVGECEEPTPDTVRPAVEDVEESSHEESATSTDQAPLSVSDKFNTQPEASTSASAEAPAEAGGPLSVDPEEASGTDDTTVPAEDVARSEEGHESLQAEIPIAHDSVTVPGHTAEEGTLAAIDHDVTAIPTADEATKFAGEAAVESASIPEDFAPENSLVNQEILEDGKDGYADKPSVQDAVDFPGIEESPGTPTSDAQLEAPASGLEISTATREAPAESEDIQLPSTLESDKEVSIDAVPISPADDVPEEVQTSGTVHELELDATAPAEDTEDILPEGPPEDEPEPLAPDAGSAKTAEDEQPDNPTEPAEEALGASSQPHFQEDELPGGPSFVTEQSLEALPLAEESSESLEDAPQVPILPDAGDENSEENAHPDDAEEIEAAPEPELTEGRLEEHGVHAFIEHPMEHSISEPVDDPQKDAISDNGIDMDEVLGSEETVAPHGSVADVSAPEITAQDVIVSEESPSAPETHADKDAPIAEAISSDNPAQTENLEPTEVAAVLEIDTASLNAPSDKTAISEAMVSDKDGLAGEPVAAEEHDDFERIANTEKPAAVEETATATPEIATLSETELAPSTLSDAPEAQLTSDDAPEDAPVLEELPSVEVVGETAAPWMVDTEEVDIVSGGVAAFADDDVSNKATKNTIQPDADIAGDDFEEIVASGNDTASQRPTPFKEVEGLAGGASPELHDASEEPVAHEIALFLQHGAPESPGGLPAPGEAPSSEESDATGLSEQEIEHDSISARELAVAVGPDVSEQQGPVADSQSLHNFESTLDEAQGTRLTSDEQRLPAVEDSQVEGSEAFDLSEPAAQEHADPVIVFQESPQVAAPDPSDKAPEKSAEEASVVEERLPSSHVVDLAQYDQDRQPDEVAEDLDLLEHEQTSAPVEEMSFEDRELPYEGTHVQVTYPSDEENVGDTPEFHATSVEDTHDSRDSDAPSGQLNVPELRDSWAYAESDQFDLEREIPILEDLSKRWATEASHEANAETETGLLDRDTSILDEPNRSIGLAGVMDASQSEEAVSLHSDSEGEAATAPETHRVFYEDRFHLEKSDSGHHFPDEHDQMEQGTPWLPSIAEEDSPIDPPDQSEAFEPAADDVVHDITSTEAAHPRLVFEDKALPHEEDVPVFIKQEEPLTPQLKVDNVRSIVSAVTEPDAGTEDLGQEEPGQHTAERAIPEIALEPAACNHEQEAEPDTAAVQPQPIIEPHVINEAEDDVGLEFAASDPEVPAAAEHPLEHISEEHTLQSYFADSSVSQSLFISGRELTPPPEKLQAEDGTTDIRPFSSADLASSHVVGSQVPLSESFLLLDQSSAPEALPKEDEDFAAEELKERLQAFHAGSGAHAEGLSRTGTSMPHHVRSAISSEFRAPTPGVEIPDLHDPLAMQMSRARSVRRRRRHTLREAEETIAAAVVIYAAAEALSPPQSPPLGGMSATRQFRSLEEDPVAFSLSDAVPVQGVDTAGRKRSIGDDEAALRNSVADLLTERKSRELPKTEPDDAPKSPRSRRLSHHSSRSSRPREADKDSGAKSPHLKHHHHHHHRKRTDSEHSGRSGSETGSPRTSKRADSGLSTQSSHSSEAKKHRTPEEQAAHDRRKEERWRLSREKEKALEAAQSSPRDTKGKGPERTTSSHKGSRRTTPKAEESQSPSPSTAKRFLALKGESVLESNFSIREGAESSRERPDAPRRSTTSRASKPRPSVDGARKVHKSPEEVDAKPKDKEKEKDIPVATEADEATAKGENEHRKKREELREKEKKGDQHKSGLRAVIKRFFTN